jgi:sphingolipid 8-(E)-desaturase
MLSWPLLVSTSTPILTPFSFKERGIQSAQRELAGHGLSRLSAFSSFGVGTEDFCMDVGPGKWHSLISWSATLSQAHCMSRRVIFASIHGERLIMMQIVLSHFSMSTDDLGPIESFAHRQLRTTSDVICSPSVAFIHGGLHLQVTHHLFPRLPRHNLKRASILVKEFAQEQGLVYAEFGFVDGNAEVMSVLKGVADQVRLMGKVANVEAKEAIEKKLANGKSKKMD